MKKFTILVDIDDTLVETLRAWLRWLNFKHGFNVQYNDIKVWDLQVAFPSLTADQICWPLCQKAFWTEVAAKATAVEYLKKLIDDGHDVYICSASHPSTISDKVEECLLKHFSYLDTTKLIFTYKKQMVNADFCIDDGIHNLIDASYRGILISTPYNELINEKDYESDMVRVNSFKEAYEFIKEQANESD